MFWTNPLFIIRSLFTVHSAIVYVTEVCRQLSSRTRMEFHPDPARKKNSLHRHISKKVTNIFQGNPSSGRLDWDNCANESRKKKFV